MAVDKRFLDDGSIIKRGNLKVTVDEDEQQEELVDDPVDEPVEEPEPPKPKKSQKPKKVQKKAAQQPVREDQRVAILKEMIDRTEHQRVAKVVDIRVHQRMYNRAMSNEERRRYELVYTNAGEDLKMIDLKLEVMRELLDEIALGSGDDGRGA